MLTTPWKAWWRSDRQAYSAEPMPPAQPSSGSLAPWAHQTHGVLEPGAKTGRLCRGDCIAEAQQAQLATTKPMDRKPIQLRQHSTAKTYQHPNFSTCEFRLVGNPMVVLS